MMGSIPSGTHETPSNRVPISPSDTTSPALMKRKDLDSHETLPPLAVVGWSCKFPGDAITSNGFWDMLCEGRTAHSTVPKDRFNVGAFFHPDFERTGTMNVDSGHFLKQDIGAFDAPFFTIQPSEARAMDPQQRILLETTYHALENSGISIDAVKGSRTSVYIGSTSHDFEALHIRDPENSPKYLSTGIGLSLLANRISWFFDLRGESMTIDTACSSSIASLHLAAQALHNGNSDMALVGGVNLMIVPDASFFHLSNMSFLSPEGRSYSFDERGNGYGKGEGAAILVLKRLDDAISHGDTIRAIVRATSINQDGRTPGLTQPSLIAQESNVRRTHARHGVNRDAVRYVEAHGTGTVLGDATECNALARAFDCRNDHQLLVGSVKANIGHLEAAAGMAGLIKTIMILENGLIPPNPLFTQSNKRLVLSDLNIRVPADLTPWPTSGLRRAAINSFGYGGTNAYAVLDDAYHYLRDHNIVGRHNTQFSLADGNSNSAKYMTGHITREARPAFKSPRLFVWSAADESGISRLFDIYTAHFSSLKIPSCEEDGLLQNLSYTLSAKRTKLPWKAFVAADNLHSLQHQLCQRPVRCIRSSTRPKLVFIFTGQGAQWYAMGRDLMQFPVFVDSLMRAEQILAKFDMPFSPKVELLKDQSVSLIDEPLMSQTLCTVLQLALVDLLADMNVHPDAVIGHSSGEIAAAYCVRGLDFLSAIRVAYYRGFHASKLAKVAGGKGTMMSVSLGMKAIQEHLRNATKVGCGSLVVACENSPNNVTISGDSTSIDHLEAAIKETKTFARRLNVPLAYHSSHMNAIAGAYKQSLNEISHEEFHDSSRSGNEAFMVSTVTGKRIDAQQLANAQYWVDNMTSPVKFVEGLTSLTSLLQLSPESATSNPQMQFLELGPHSALRRPIRDTMRELISADNFMYDSLLERNVPALTTGLNVLGQLYCRGSGVDITKVNEPSFDRGTLKQLVDLPEYPFNHSQRYWDESRMSEAYRFRQAPRHELLGALSSERNSLEPHWTLNLKHTENPWMRDHSIDSANLYPAAGMIVMAVEAARQVIGPNHRILSYHLTNVQFMRAIILEPVSRGTEVQMCFSRPDDIVSDAVLEFDFSLSVYRSDKWTLCCSGRIEAEVTGDNSETPRDFSERTASTDVVAKHVSCKSSCTEAIGKARFYENLAKDGFGYGPGFQVLEDVHYNATTLAAYSDIALDSWKAKFERLESWCAPCVIHPTDLDGMIHLAMAAISQGATQPLPAMVPARCRSIWISNKLLGRRPETKVNVCARSTLRTFREANFTISALDHDSKPLVIIEGWCERALTDTSVVPTTGTETGKICYMLKWKPDIEHLSNDAIKLICQQRSMDEPCTQYRPAELEFISLRYAAIVGGLANGKEIIPGLGPHTKQYLNWAQRVCSDEHRGEDTRRHDGDRILSLHADVDESLIDSLAEKNIECSMTIRVGKAIHQILRGEIAVSDIMTSEFMRQLYQGPSLRKSYMQVEEYIQLLAHKNSNISILEIGTGTGGLTVPVVEALAAQPTDSARSPLSSFGTYDATDLSLAVMADAQDRLSSRSKAMNFLVLDIERDPTLQGFAEGTYDLICASLVLHTLSNVTVSLRNIRRLLKPNGKLILVELTNRDCARVHFIFGLLPQWWDNIEESRKSCPLWNVEQWDTNLKDCGFSGVDIDMADTEILGEAMTHVLITTAKDNISRAIVSAQSPLIVVDATSNVQRDIAEQLRVMIGIVELQSIVPFADIKPAVCSNRHCIVLVELDRSFIRVVNEALFEKLQILLSVTTSTLWVTTGSGFAPTHPDRDLITGLGRTLRSENWANNFTHLSIDRLLHITEAATQICSIYSRNSGKPQSQCEDVYVVRDGRVHIGRLHESDELNALIRSRTRRQMQEQANLKERNGRPLKLTVGSSGMLDSPHFVDDPDLTLKNIGNADVEVRPIAVGMNSYDLLTDVDDPYDQNFGIEFVGTILRAGANTDLSPGDTVLGLTLKGAFKSTIHIEASLVARIDEHAISGKAASIPLAFVTAYYCLIDRANLQPDETVLIHNASGAIGQAAVQIATWVGATLFVTTSSEAKRRILIEQYGIPEERTFLNHSSHFATAMDIATKGTGIDLVLSTSSGEYIRASWSIIAPMGKFIQLVQPNGQTSKALPVQPSSNNVTFMWIEMLLVVRKFPAMINRLLKTIVGLYQEGVIRAPEDLRLFDLGNIEAAFRWLREKNDGVKAVVTFNQYSSILIAPQATPPLLFSNDATYVIAGGFGGIGRTLIKWMVSRGARNFLVPSRSGQQSQAAQLLIQDVRQSGVYVLGPKCNIADHEQVRSMVEQAAGVMPPIKGCVQAATALHDALFVNMTHEQWSSSIESKVSGTWNLHACLPRDLDFFVTMSSVVSITGLRGQGNYAAGNAYEDAIIRHRLSLGETGFALNIGPVRSVGLVAEAGLEAELLKNGLEAIEVSELLVLFEYACFNGRPDRNPERNQLITGPSGVRHPQAKSRSEIYWFTRPIFSALNNYFTETDDLNVEDRSPAGDAADIVKLLTDNMSSDIATVEAILGAFKVKLSHVLDIALDDIEASKPVYALGIDSLVSLEIRHWFSRNIQADLTVFEIMDASSLFNLCRLAWTKSSYRSSANAE